MNGEPANIFKTVRVLWFPMSLNAVILGTGAALSFWVGTWLVALLLGHGSWGETHFFATNFGTLAIGSLTHFAWPRGNVGWLFGWQLLLFFALLSTFGVAICRILVLRVARDEYCTVKEAWGYAWKVKLTTFIFPLAVAIPLVFLYCCNLLYGLVGSIPWVGPILMLPLLPLVIASGVIMVATALSSLLATGLIPAAIATERKGTYDSLGKCINYVFARPIPLLLYLALTTLFLSVIHYLFLRIGIVERILSASILIDGGFEGIAVGDTRGLEGVDSFFARLYWVAYSLFRLWIWGLLISFGLGAFTSAFLIFRHDVDGVSYEAVAKDGGAPKMETPANPPLVDGLADEKAKAASDEKAKAASDEKPASEDKPASDDKKPEA